MVEVLLDRTDRGVPRAIHSVKLPDQERIEGDPVLSIA